MRYVNIANGLHDSEVKQKMSTQIYTAFVGDENRSDADSEIAINCTQIVIDTFNASLYSPILFCVDTTAPF